MTNTLLLLACVATFRALPNAPTHPARWAALAALCATASVVRDQSPHVIVPAVMLGTVAIWELLEALTGRVRRRQRTSDSGVPASRVDTSRP